MTAEVAILRAYALASQGKYTEAEVMLKSVPGVIDSPQGADLYARILCATDRMDMARRVWQEILHVQPDNAPAKQAINALDNPAALGLDGDACSTSWKGKILVAAIVAMVMGVAFSVGKSINRGKATDYDNIPVVIAEAKIGGKISSATLQELQRGFLTNFNDRCGLIIKGGNGRYVTDRQKRLAVIAEWISDVAKIPSSKIFFQSAAEPTEDVILQVVPAYLERKRGSNEGE